MPVRPNVWKDDRVYTLNVRLRTSECESWQSELEPYLDDIIEVIVAYQNTSCFQQAQTTIRYELADGLELIPGTVQLFNESYPRGTALDDQPLCEDGLEIGDYAPFCGAEVHFQLRPIKRFFAHRTGVCTLFNHAYAQVRGASLQTYVRSTIYLKCRNTPVTAPPT